MSAVSVSIQPISLVGSQRSKLVTAVSGAPTAASVQAVGDVLLYAPSTSEYATVSPTSVVVSVVGLGKTLQEALNAIEVAADKSAASAASAATPVAPSVSITLNDDNVGHSIEKFPQGLTLTYSCLIGHEDQVYAGTTSSTDNQKLVVVDVLKPEVLETQAMDDTNHPDKLISVLNGINYAITTAAADVKHGDDRVAVFIHKNSAVSAGAVMVNADGEFELVTTAPLAVATGSLAVTQAWSVDGNLYVQGSTFVDPTTTNYIRVIRDLSDAAEVSTVVNLGATVPTYFSVAPDQSRVYWSEVDDTDDLIRYCATDDHETYESAVLYLTRSNETYGSITHLTAVGEKDVFWISSATEGSYSLFRALDATVKEIDFDDVVPDAKFGADKLYHTEDVAFMPSGWMKYWHDESDPYVAIAGYCEFTRNEDIDNDVVSPTTKMIPCVCILSDFGEKSPSFHYYFAENAFRADAPSGAFVRLATFAGKGRLVAAGADNDSPAILINHSALARKSVTAAVTKATDPSAPSSGMSSKTLGIILGSVFGGLAVLMLMYFLGRYYKWW